MTRRMFAASYVGARSAPAAHAPIAGQRDAALQAAAGACLRCQLVGRRKLLCGQRDACSAPPRDPPLGLALMALWLATTIGFLISAW